MSPSCKIGKYFPRVFLKTSLLRRSVFQSTLGKKSRSCTRSHEESSISRFIVTSKTVFVFFDRNKNLTWQNWQCQVVKVNPRTAGGCFPPPSGFSSMAGKPQRATPQNLAQLFLHQLHICVQIFTNQLERSGHQVTLSDVTTQILCSRYAYSSPQ